LASAVKVGLFGVMSQENGCVVCGTRDSRVLSSTRLANGTVVTVCGSHELAHLRADAPAKTVEELRVMVGDRRTERERRTEADELALHLSLAFSGDRRASRERRSS
jgi:hypothetical protein